MYTPRDTVGLCVCMCVCVCVCVCVYMCVFEREAQRDGVPIDWEGDRDTTRPASVLYTCSK